MRVKLARLLVTRKNRTHPGNYFSRKTRPPKSEPAYPLDDLGDQLREGPPKEVVTLIFTNPEERRKVVHGLHNKRGVGAQRIKHERAQVSTYGWRGGGGRLAATFGGSPAIFARRGRRLQVVHARCRVQWCKRWCKAIGW